MAENTSIEWCDATFNPWTGCTKVSPGCDGCYAESWSKRSGDKVGKWGPGAPRVRTTPANWRKPLKWDETPFYACSCCGWRGDRPTYDVLGSDVAAASCPHCVDAGRDHVLRIARRRVFCASLADVFDNEVPVEWRSDLLELIAVTPNLDWLLLTKRIGNAARMIAEAQGDRPPISKWAAWPLPNVWLGATIVNQPEADRDIPKLLATPATVRFLSMEPLLGPVDLETIHNTDFGKGQPYLHPLIGRVSDGHGDGCNAPSIDWVIVGGESGHGARPMHPDWVRSLRDQCAAAGVPFHFKQWGEWRPVAVHEARAGNYRLVSRDERTPIGDGCFHMKHQVEAMAGEAPYDWQCPIEKVGKKAAGRLLNGIEHNGFPGGAA